MVHPLFVNQGKIDLHVQLSGLILRITYSVANSAPSQEFILYIGQQCVALLKLKEKNFLLYFQRRQIKKKTPLKLLPINSNNNIVIAAISLW